ncbi:MAG: type II toxin-antitoxin system VapC family toxin [Egibacteraceae bacterium]
MTVFVDTSALFALLDPDDAEHLAAVAYLASLEEPATPLITHDYVVVEASALVQRRLGMTSVRRLHERVLPAVNITSVPAQVRQAAVAALLAAGRRGVSLVDWVSFEVMRRRELDKAFTFDDDFGRHGFTVLP